MPPSRTTKKVTTVTASSFGRANANVNTRAHGTRQRRTQRVIEVQVEGAEDELQGSEDETGYHVEEDANSQTPASSQGNDDLANILQTMVDDQRKRRAARRTAIIKAYENNLSTTRTSIDTLFAGYEAQSTKVHTAHMSRLKTLFAKKKDLELQMDEKHKSLQEAYVAHSRDLQAVLEARMSVL
ncbi:hypothetical protein GQ43DRAFT_443554 [Delitschia confertaspora ATCC 74209]|uniref:Uncharacterized protein n=1 Tax=Delitschia confertaspora ATCC 74209 TaxID=1513339 RepID=A0A9P4JF00_9PLEO|nr:hypothetical protein GQ43DRAFT_443554 [Delitschia confertaspora ATCC 74209]